jgi:hypothetical protein
MGNSTKLIFYYDTASKSAGGPVGTLESSREQNEDNACPSCTAVEIFSDGYASQEIFRCGKNVEELKMIR